MISIKLIIYWIIAGGIIGHLAWKHVNLNNTLADLRFEKEKKLSECDNWVRWLENTYTDSHLSVVKSMSVGIGLPYVQGLWERYAPDCCRSMGRQKADESSNPNGLVIVTHIETKRDWFDTFQYLLMVQRASPYNAIPVYFSSIEDYKTLAPNRIYHNYTKNLDFQYVMVDPTVPLFRNSFWPKPISGVYQFHVDKEFFLGSSYDRYIDLKYMGKYRLRPEIKVKRVRDILQVPEGRSAGYHFPQSRTYIKWLKSYGISFMIRSIKGDAVMSLADINIGEFDMYGIKVIIPRVNELKDGNGKFIPIYGHIIDNSPCLDGTYRVEILEAHRQYVGGRNIIWVFPKDLYIGLKLNSYKSLHNDLDTSDVMRIGIISGGNDVEVRYNGTDVYLKAPTTSNIQRYPHINHFINSHNIGDVIHLFELNDTIYLKASMSMSRFSGVPTYYISNLDSHMYGPEDIIDVVTDTTGMSTVHKFKLQTGSEIPADGAYLALDSRYYDDFGSPVNPRSKLSPVRIIGKIKGSDFWVVHKIGMYNPTFHIIDSAIFGKMSFGYNMTEIDSNGKIRIFENGSQNPDPPQQVEQVQQIKQEIISHPIGAPEFYVAEDTTPIKQPKVGDTKVYDGKNWVDVEVTSKADAFLGLVDTVDSKLNKNKARAREEACEPHRPPTFFHGTAIEWNQLWETHSTISDGGARPYYFHKYTGARLELSSNITNDTVIVRNPINNVCFVMPSENLMDSPAKVKGSHIDPNAFDATRTAFHSYLFYIGGPDGPLYKIYPDCVLFTTDVGHISFPKIFCPDYGVNPDEYDQTDVIMLNIPDSMIPAVRKAFLFTAVRGYFNPKFYVAKYGVNTSIAYQAMMSAMDRNLPFRGDLLMPGLQFNKYMVTMRYLMNSAHSTGIRVETDIVENNKKYFKNSPSKCHIITYGLSDQYEDNIVRACELDAISFKERHEVRFLSDIMKPENPTVQARLSAEADAVWSM